MTVVVLGIDALEPKLVDPEDYPNLTLTARRPIETADSALDVQAAIKAELRGDDHLCDREEESFPEAGAAEVKRQLEDLGHM